MDILTTFHSEYGILPVATHRGSEVVLEIPPRRNPTHGSGEAGTQLSPLFLNGRLNMRWNELTAFLRW